MADSVGGATADVVDVVTDETADAVGSVAGETVDVDITVPVCLEVVSNGDKQVNIQKKKQASERLMKL